jgi:hypothetical protein
MKAFTCTPLPIAQLLEGGGRFKGGAAGERRELYP